MSLRADFKEVEGPMNRLRVYGDAFDEFNREKWPHYRNREDFERIFKLSPEEQYAYEHLYMDGRDCSVTMSSMLCGGFNDVRHFPTLRSYVAAFEGGWVYQTTELKAKLAEVVALGEKHGKQPWAVSAMADLYQNQIEMLEATAVVLAQLKQTGLYMREGGEPEPQANRRPAGGDESFFQNFLAFVFLLGVGLIGLKYLGAVTGIIWLVFAIAVAPLGLGFMRGAHKLEGNHLVKLYTAGVGQISVILKPLTGLFKGSGKK